MSRGSAFISAPSQVSQPARRINHANRRSAHSRSATITFGSNAGRISNLHEGPHRYAGMERFLAFQQFPADRRMADVTLAYERSFHGERLFGIICGLTDDPPIP